MYWTEIEGFGSGGDLTDRIGRANLDGTDKSYIVTQDNAAIFSIALDVAGGKIFWTDVDDKTFTGKIRRANLDGSNPEDLVTNVDLPFL